MELNVPPEPDEIREKILAKIVRWHSVDNDSMAVWYGNMIQRHLWSFWKDKLKLEGFTWQKFLKLMKFRTDDAILWVKNKISWEEFVKRALDSLNGPLGEIIRRS